MKLLQITALALLGLYFVGVGLLYFFQRQLLYIKTPEYQHNLTTLAVTNEGESIKVIVLNPGKPDAMMYFGGNAEAVVFNERPFTEHFNNHTIYLVNYRGYGGSSGQPSEAGLYSDALAVYDKIAAQHPRISVMGRSLGSGVATYLASKRQVRTLVLITPYDSIESVAQRHFPIFPVFLLLKDKYDSINRAKDISAKTLIVMAEQDTVIPNPHSMHLSTAFAQDRLSTITIANADHHNLFLQPKYFTTLKAFVNQD